MNSATINGIEISYGDRGSGRPIVFLHAFPLNQSMWNDQVEALSGDYRVITPDWRGFGGSSPGPATMDDFADDLAGLLDHLGVTEPIICGLSMGGYAAMAFLRRHPGRISALILADTRSTPDTEEARRTRLETAASVRRDGVAILLPGMTQRLLGQSTLATRPDIVERVNSMILSANSEGVARALEAMAAREDSTGLLRNVDVPTLIICGEEDVLTPPAEASQMSRAVHGSQLTLIAGAGHLPNIEKSAEFNETVMAFLRNARTLNG